MVLTNEHWSILIAISTAIRLHDTVHSWLRCQFRCAGGPDLYPFMLPRRTSRRRRQVQVHNAQDGLATSTAVIGLCQNQPYADFDAQRTGPIAVGSRVTVIPTPGSPFGNTKPQVVVVVDDYADSSSTAPN